MKWITNVKDWWKLWSVRIFLLVAVLSYLGGQLTVIQDYIPEPYRGYIISFVALIGAVSRLLVQTNLAKPEDLTLPNEKA